MIRVLKLPLSVLVISMILSLSVRANEAKGHLGEAGMLDVNIQFSDSFGTTVTNAGGTDYHFWGIVIHEDKVYVPSLWGEFPLYFFGERVGVTVTVTNKGPRNKAKIIIKTESNALHTDGTLGVALSPVQVQEVFLAKGETKVIDASFIAEYAPGADSGLDMFSVKVLHQNEGGNGSGNQEPSLIMVKKGVFCPPEYKKR